MIKNIHEIRDPIHVFIKLDSQERQVLDSQPVQRLRHINQLALTYLLYPGATHKRFEHSLGVMELASRIFDVVTHPEHLSDNIRDLFPQINDLDKCKYWRRVLRMAALCHDIGHLPFSHASEDELLPNVWNHEKITRELILSSQMQPIWDDLEPPLKPEHIVKLALGKKEAPDLEFTDWEIMLAEIIVGDAFGADRMDYLLRDSFHTGVAYGKFDHFRLIDTLRILPPPASGKEGEISNEQQDSEDEDSNLEKGGRTNEKQESKNILNRSGVSFRLSADGGVRCTYSCPYSNSGKTRPRCNGNWSGCRWNQGRYERP